MSSFENVTEKSLTENNQDDSFKENLIEAKKESLFFAYSSRWFINLESQDIPKNWDDLSCIEVIDDYAGIQHPGKLNLFIMSQAGKPLYYRYGQDSEIIPLMGVAYTLFISMAEAHEMKLEAELNKDQKALNNSKLFIYGDQQIFVFINSPPLIMFSVADYSTKPSDLVQDPCQNLTNIVGPLYDYEYEKISSDQQISLLIHIKNFIFCLTTESLLIKTYKKYKNFNFNQMLSGSEKLLDSWLNRLDTNLSINLNGVQYLNILTTYRNSITDTIWKAISSKNTAFAILMYKDYVVSLIQQNPYKLSPGDIHLIANMINTSSSFKSGETWTPICLPNFNSKGFLYAYISYLDPSKRYCLTLLTDQVDAFFQLSEAKKEITEELMEGHYVSILNEWLENGKHVYRVEDLDLLPPPGRSKLRHFLYLKKPGRFVTAPVFSNEPGPDSKYSVLSATQRRHIFCAYVDLHFRVRNSDYYQPAGQNDASSVGSFISYLRVTKPDSIYIVWLHPTYEMYASYDPSTSDEQIQNLYDLTLKWIAREQKSLFPTFN